MTSDPRDAVVEAARAVLVWAEWQKKRRGAPDMGEPNTGAILALRTALSALDAAPSRSPEGRACDDHRPDGPDPIPNCRCVEIDRLCNRPNRDAAPVPPIQGAHPISALSDLRIGVAPFGRCRLSLWGLTHDHYQTSACVEWLAAPRAVPGAGTKGGGA